MLSSPKSCGRLGAPSSPGTRCVRSARRRRRPRTPPETHRCPRAQHSPKRGNCFAVWKPRASAVHRRRYGRSDRSPGGICPDRRPTGPASCLAIPNAPGRAGSERKRLRVRKSSEFVVVRIFLWTQLHRHVHQTRNFVADGEQDAEMFASVGVFVRAIQSERSGDVLAVVAQGNAERRFRTQWPGSLTYPGSTEGFPFTMGLPFSATQPESPWPIGISAQRSRRLFSPFT